MNLGTLTPQSLEMGGEPRQYLLYLPEDYEENKPHPLLLFFSRHG